jgi:hypothetical protein
MVLVGSLIIHNFSIHFRFAIYTTLLFMNNELVALEDVQQPVEEALLFSRDFFI